MECNILPFIIMTKEGETTLKTFKIMLTLEGLSVRFWIPVAMIWRPIYISVKIQILEGFFIIWSQKQYHRHP